jgi:hypothetical protein
MVAAGIRVEWLAERRLWSVERRRRLVFSLGEMRRSWVHRGTISCSL